MFRNFLLTLSVFLLFIPNNTYGSLGVFDEDLELSKKIPLISGIPETVEDIRKGNKAAITLCTVPLNNLFGNDHVSLVFEFKHPLQDEINLFSVHFGGDGDSSDVKKGRPTIDNARDTLRKVFRGKETTAYDEDYIDPLYSRKFVFIVEKDQAIETIKKIQNDHNLVYSLPGWTYGSENYYNCCTYVNRVLKDAGIETGFEKSWYPKSASLLTSCCQDYKLKEEQQEKRQSFIPTEYCYFLSSGIEEYRCSVESFFNKALDFKKSSNYDESMKYLLEAAKRGHPIAQCFVGFCYYNNDQIKDEFSTIVKYAENHKEFHQSLNNATSCFYNLISSYNKFSSCTYFRNSFAKSNEQQAFKWMKISSENNFPISQGILGYFYMFGKGIETDKPMGIFYAKKTAEIDSVSAKNIHDWYQSSKRHAEQEAIRKMMFRRDHALHNKISFNSFEFLQKQRVIEIKIVEDLFGFSDDRAEEYLSFAKLQGFVD